MLIDCDTCRVRGTGCDDCVISVLLANSEDRARIPTALDLDDSEQQAVNVLAASGLVPPLRLVPSAPRRRKSA